ncbi:hypothetical protein YM304_12400 [Ilumatobacter coccineus YM16-304]|uniref:Uncharacterized protein n=1 Tax=Ilumatobacter coccineus (strain NBRC 103263 / KCTC 29153 / YM16-304) TaxID=1313172 RepID=A0A6C7DZM4_ILUCY|nr:hypothetical protein YM304_12400 [Ilumatobacter coccineus YM16-304]
MISDLLGFLVLQWQQVTFGERSSQIERVSNREPVGQKHLGSSHGHEFSSRDKGMIATHRSDKPDGWVEHDRGRIAARTPHQDPSKTAADRDRSNCSDDLGRTTTGCGVDRCEPLSLHLWVGYWKHAPRNNQRRLHDTAKTTSAARWRPAEPRGLVCMI